MLSRCKFGLLIQLQMDIAPFRAGEDRWSGQQRPSHVRLAMVEHCNGLWQLLHSLLMGMSGHAS